MENVDIVKEIKNGFGWCTVEYVFQTYSHSKTFDELIGLLKTLINQGILVTEDLLNGDEESLSDIEFAKIDYINQINFFQIH